MKEQNQRGQVGECMSKFSFVVNNAGKIQFQRQLLHICNSFFRSTLFSFNLTTFFCPGTTFSSFNFQRIIAIIIIWAFCFGIKWVLSKTKTFKILLFFTKLYLKMSFEYYNAYKLVPFNDKPFWREFYSKFINSA